MADCKQFSLFLLLTLLSSLHTHARDSQFFNKVPSTTNNVVVPNNNKEVPTNQQQQEPNFLPENENGYGLYGHESGQNPPATTAEPSTTTTAAAEPSTTTATTAATTATPYNSEFKQPVHKYLPKNYNPVAYVTQPEDVNDNDSTTFTEERSFATNPTNYYNGEKNSYNNQQEEEKTEFRRYPTTTNNRNGGNYYYNGGSSFNNQPQGMSDTRYRGSATFNNGGANSFQPQGMSDTRFMENGKYFYDINTEKYSTNHPYESLRGVRARGEYDNRNFYGNAENNGYEYNGENSMGGYQNQEEFQDEERMP